MEKSLFYIMKKNNAGIIRISEDLTISPGYSFEEFKGTRFYKNQDGIKIIYLDEQQMIELNSKIKKALLDIKLVWLYLLYSKGRKIPIR